MLLYINEIIMEANVKKYILWGIIATCVLLLGVLIWYVLQFSEYTDKTYRFSIKCPSGWNIVHPAPAGVAVEFVAPKETELDTVNENINIVVQDVPAKIATLESFSATIEKQLKAVFNNIKIVENKSVMINGRRAHRLSIETDKSNKLRLVHVWVIKGSRAYIITFLGANEKYPQYASTVDAVVNSFKLK